MKQRLLLRGCGYFILFSILVGLNIEIGVTGGNSDAALSSKQESTGRQSSIGYYPLASSIVKGTKGPYVDK